MGKAILSYTLDRKSSSEANELVLMSGSLRTIDNFTRDFKSIEDLRQSSEFQEKINDFIKRNERFILEYNNGFNGEFTIAFIIDSGKREYLPLLINDDKPVRTRTSALEDVKSEVERSRKLLFRSKDKLFLRRMLKDEMFSDTTDFDIKLKISEYKEMVKKGFKPRLVEGAYYLTIQEILEYAASVETYGLMRSLIEDSLEVWKENVLSLDDELLYYYSRHFRLAINSYNKEKLNKRLVTNLKANTYNLISLVKEGRGRVNPYPVKGRYQFINNKTKRMEENFA